MNNSINHFYIKVLLSFLEIQFIFYKERLIVFYELWMFKKLFMRKGGLFIHDLHVTSLLLSLDLYQEGFIYDLHVILLLIPLN